MKYCCILLFLTATTLYSQNKFFSPLFHQQKVAHVFAGDSLQVSEQMIIFQSEKISSDSTVWLRDRDYRIDYSTSTIYFLQNSELVNIECKIIPKTIKSEFFLFEPIDWSDSTSFSISPKKTNLFMNTTNLTISGSKTIAVSVANDKDFALDQSLFLNINGELSTNLFIEAQLTDSQSPITPEGDSREISNLDQLFIRLYGKQYELSFGDLEVSFEGTQFINYAPKFEGLKARYFPNHEYLGAFAISKGKKTTITQSGIDAKQGPYYLHIKENVGIQIVPGSEEIHLNGNRLERGDDYSIDYAEGSITFSNEHFITSESFIQASFQYTDEAYKQLLYLSSTKHQIGNNFEIRSHLVFERDDKNNPLQGFFSEEDIDSLQAGGDSAIIGNGIQESEGTEGNYLWEQDHFVYTESDSLGNYLLTFYYVGSGNGDYDLSENGTYYIYVGENTGSYRIGKELPAPAEKLNVDLLTSYETNFFSFQNEFLYSHSDQNLFSLIDDEDNDGFVNQVECRFSPDYDRIQPNLVLSYRKKSTYLSSFVDILNATEIYELTSDSDTLETDEWQGNLHADIANMYQPKLIVKFKKASNYSRQYYLEMSHNLLPKKWLPDLSYRTFWLNQRYNTDNSSLFLNEQKIRQHSLKMSYQISAFRLGWNYFFRNDISEYKKIDDSERIKKNWKLYLRLESDRQKSSEIYFEQTRQDSLINTKKFHSKKQLSGGNRTILSFTNHQIRFDYSHHLLEDSTTTHFDLADVATRHNFFQNALTLQTNYGIKNVQFYPKEREFLFVGNNLGSYDQDSTFVGLGEGDYDWEITGIDYENPSLSVEVKGNLNIFINPARITASFWKKLQSETFLQIIENSKLKQKEKIYYFHPEYIMNTDETLYGFQSLRHTFWFDLITNKVLPKMQIESEKIMDNRYQTLEETKRRSGEIACTILSVWRSNFELGFETSKEEESRYHSLITNNVYSIEVRNRLYDDLNLTTKGEIVKEKGSSSISSGNYRLSSIEWEETVQYFLFNKYRFYARLNLKKNDKTGEFLSGLAEKRNGMVFKWTVQIDYKINEFTTANFLYNGKSYPQEEVNHQLELEVKAEF